jgi:hypothetical protein
MSCHLKPAYIVLRSEELALPRPTLDEHTRDTGIPGETNPVELRPNFAHLPLEVHVLRENVATEGASRRAVDVQHFAFALARRQPGQERDSAFSNGGFLDRGREQVSVPEDALLGVRSAVRVKQDTVVEESEQHNLHPHREVEALYRVGAVACRVPKVVHGGDMVSRRREHRLKRLKIAVNVTQDCPHR